MTTQPRDLAAETLEQRLLRCAATMGGGASWLLNETAKEAAAHIAALSRELEDLRRPLAELKKEAESEEGMEPQRMMQYLCRRVDALQKDTRRLQPDNERLRAENERLASCLSTANSNHEKFERLWYLEQHKVEHLQSELNALRRPVEQSADVESIRATIAELKQYWAANPGDVPYNLTRYFEHGDLLLTALDATARQLRERVEMLSVVQDALSERNRECVELRERIERLEGALRQIRDFPVCDRGALVDACKRALAAAESPIPVRGKSLAQQCIEDELKPKEQQRWP